MRIVVAPYSKLGSMEHLVAEEHVAVGIRPLDQQLPLVLVLDDAAHHIGDLDEVAGGGVDILHGTRPIADLRDAVVAVIGDGERASALVGDGRQEA